MELALYSFPFGLTKHARFICFLFYELIRIELSILFFKRPLPILGFILVLNVQRYHNVFSRGEIQTPKTTFCVTKPLCLLSKRAILICQMLNEEL